MEDINIITPAFGNYQEILAHFRRFLKGEIPNSPSDILEEETGPIVPQLLAINAAGILTFCSQPGLKATNDLYEKGLEKGELKEEELEGEIEELEGEIEESGESEEYDTDFREYHQRAFLSCYVPRELICKLDHKILLTEFIYFSEELTELQNVPVDSIPVTVYINDYSPEVITSVPIKYKLEDLEFALINSPESVKGIVTKDLVQMHIIDPIWGRPTYLFDELVKMLQQIVIPQLNQ